MLKGGGLSLDHSPLPSALLLDLKYNIINNIYAYCHENNLI
jgi:hypothetical protein